MNLIKQNLKSIYTLCQEHKVERLYAFGSVLTNRFGEQSDVDFLVKFAGVDPPLYFDNYMNLKEALENLLKHSVDLVEDQAIRNPILRKSVDETKKLVYGRTDRKVAV